MGIAVALALAGCSSAADPSVGTAAEESTGASDQGSVPASAGATAADTSEEPHQAVLVVVDVAEHPSSAAGARVIGVRLKGDVGTSAVIRTLEIHAQTVPLSGSRCTADLIPVVLRPSHADALRPVLADQTREVIVRSLGRADADASGGASVRFRSGPIPSLNGAFGGWVSFELPVASVSGRCALELRGTVTVVAGESVSVALPVLRIDTGR